MDEEGREDRIIQERKFKIGFDLNLEDIGIENNDNKAIKKIKKQDKDEALGSFFDPFKQEDTELPGIIHTDGSVTSPPDRDLVTDISIEGERKINWIIMVSMIVIYSIISILVGSIFNVLISSIILLILAVLGFTLGEMWVPDEKMHLLGVTWVIISMKVLYGLILEFRNWGIIGAESLLFLLLGLVCVNLFVAYRHNHDAIAAQSTLVLLAIGSSTGSLLGEEGVAGMILVATVLLHSLAIHRKSGNLAALGIASSNLWIGMHAITDGFKIGELVIIKLDSTLLLFILMMSVTGLNAAMAARFSREDNWFSNAFKISGLGRPGLWGVSVSLGMLGALLSVTANREDLGYALGMVTFLGMAFGGSYLSVRGVSNTRIIKPILFSLPLLITVIIFDNQISNFSRLDGYDIFTIFGSFVTGFILLRDQRNVSDRVLWLGAVSILILLVILVPSNDSYSSEKSVFLLLILLSILHIGTTILAIRRVSPSLAGVTVILPWIWILFYEIIKEIINTIILVNNGAVTKGFIQFEFMALFYYLSLSLVLMIIVNTKLGNTNINLASKFLGITEISAVIKNSEILQLWNIGLWLPLVTIITLARLNLFTSLTLLFLLSFLILLHTISQRLGQRKGEDNNLLYVIVLSILIIQWIHGLDIYMIILTGLSISVIISKNELNRHIVPGMLLMAMPILISSTGRRVSIALDGANKISNIETPVISLGCTIIIVGIYLKRAKTFERILKPTLACLFLIITNISLSLQSEIILVKYISFGLFIYASIWLVSYGELRSELKTMAIRDTRIELARKKNLESNGLNTISEYDPLIASLNEKRARSREQSVQTNIEDLYTSDISHKPIIVLTMLIVTFIAGIGNALINGPNPIMLLIIGIFSILLVGIARYRTKALNLSLPHIFGMEIPIGVTIFGLILVHNISHIGPMASNSELLDMAVLIILLMVLCIISIIYQDNLIERIPVAIDWFIVPLFMSRFVGAIMNESLPFPFTVNPFDAVISIDNFLLEWKLPWLLLEFLLILTILCDFWIVNRRESVLSDRKKANGGIRNLAIVALSFGPAGLLAIIVTIRQSYRSKQTNTIGIAILSLVMVMIAIGSWFSIFMDLVPNLTLLLGGVMLVLCVFSGILEQEEWTIMASINSHIFILLGLIWSGYYNEIYFTILIIIMSTTVWIVGIFQLRRVLRLLGLLDLSIAIVFSLIFVNDIFDPTNLLICLAIIAIQLGVIGWLGIYHEKDLLKD